MNTCFKTGKKNKIKLSLTKAKYMQVQQHLFLSQLQLFCCIQLPPLHLHLSQFFHYE